MAITSITLFTWTIFSLLVHFVAHLLMKSREYTSEIERLRRDLIATREKNGFFVDELNYRAMETKIGQPTKDIANKVTNIDHLKAEVLKFTELFERTKNELEATSLNLHTTEKHLAETKFTLDNTKKQLTETIQECNQQKYLISERVEQNVIAQANSVIPGVGNLHAKVERKRDVEAQKDEISKRFQSRHEHIMIQMVDNIKRHTADSKIFFTDFHETLGKKAAKQAAALSEITELITTVTTGQTNKLDDVLKALYSDAEKNQQQIDLIIDLTRRFKKDTVGHYQHFEKSFSSLLSLISQMLNKNTALIKSSTDNMLTKLEAHESSVRAHCTSLLDSVHKHNQECKSDNDKYLQDNEQMKRQLNEANRLIENAKNFVAMQYEEAVNRALNVKNVLDSRLEEINVTMGALGNANAQIHERTELSSANRETFTNNLERNINLYQSSTIDDVRATMEQNQENAEKLFSNTYNIQKKIEEEKTEIIDLGQKILTDTEQQHIMIDSKLRDQSKAIASNLDTLQSQIQSLKQDLRINNNKVEDVLEAQQIAIQSDVQDSQEQLARQCAVTEDSSIIMLQDFNQMQVDVKRYFTHEVRREESTGNSALRREFSNPRDFAATSSREILLQRFRAQHMGTDAPLLSLIEESDKANTTTSPMNSTTDLSHLETEVRKNSTLPPSKSLKQKGKKVVSKNSKVKQRKPLMAQNSTA